MTLLPGETVDTEVHFPDDHPDASRRGKSRRVRLKLFEVKRQDLPPLDDAFAREVGEFETVTALREAIRQDLEPEAGRKPMPPCDRRCWLSSSTRTGSRPRIPWCTGFSTGLRTCTRSPTTNCRASRRSSGRSPCNKCNGIWSLTRWWRRRVCGPPRRTWTSGSGPWRRHGTCPPETCTPRCRSPIGSPSWSERSPRRRCLAWLLPQSTVDRGERRDDWRIHVSAVHHRAFVAEASGRTTSSRACSWIGSSSWAPRSTTTSPTSSSPSCCFSRRTIPRRTSTSTSTPRAASCRAGWRSTTRCSTSARRSTRSAWGWPRRWDRSCSAPGRRGKRSALPHSRIMIHQPSGGAQGTAADIEIQAQGNPVSPRQDAHAVRAAHRSADARQIERDMDRDRFMSADEAKAYGLIDTVFTPRKVSSCRARTARESLDALLSGGQLTERFT